MNRSFLYLIIALAVPFAAFAPVAPKKDTTRDNLITVETRSLEVLTKASIYYFQVAKKTEFNTFDRELEFITEDRLQTFNSFEKDLKHSQTVRLTCEPVKQLLETLETAQQDLLTCEAKSKQVVVKLSFKKPSDSVLIKFEFYKIFNEETKTIESVGLRISIFGYKDAASETLINFLKSCALQNTAWQDIKPFAIGGIISAGVVGLILGGRRVQANETAMKAVEPVLKGLAEEVATKLDQYHLYHPQSLVQHTHTKYSKGLFGEPTPVAPWFEYTKPTVHEGIWQRLGFTFAAGTPSESAHKKSASVVVTAWLPGSFNAFCQTAAWEAVTEADQERIIIVPYSVFKADVSNYQEQQTKWIATEAQLKERHAAAVAETTEKLSKKASADRIQKLLLQTAAHTEQLAQAKQSILMTERLNIGAWTVVVVNDGDTAIDLTTDSPEKAFLANLSSYVAVTTEKLSEAATKKFAASCKFGATSFEVTAEATTATLQQTLAQLVVDALLLASDKAVSYAATTGTTTPATTELMKVTKTTANVLPSRRTIKAANDISLCATPRLPMHIEFARDLAESSLGTRALAGLTIFIASTNEFTSELKHFLTRSTTIDTKQSPHVVIVPSPLMNLCENAEFIAALNAAQATVVVLNIGEQDKYKEDIIMGNLKTTENRDFVDVAKKLLATAERAIIVKAGASNCASWKHATKQPDFKNTKYESYPARETADALKKIYKA